MITNEASNRSYNMTKIIFFAKWHCLSHDVNVFVNSVGSETGRNGGRGVADRGVRSPDPYHDRGDL